MSGSALRFDAAPADHDLPPSVRVDARLDLALDAPAGTTRIARRHEQGAFRLRFPKSHCTTPEVCLVNIAGGLAGGDRVSFRFDAGPDAGAQVSSAAAERIYRSAGDVTRIETRLTLDDRARVLWLPQETILHGGARLDRRFAIDVAPSARLLFGEMLYFGRRASGETFTAGHLRESWRLRLGPTLTYADELRITGEFAADILHPVALFEHVAVATLILCAQDADEALDPIRATLASRHGIEGGASNLGGAVVIRLAARDAAGLRQTVLGLAAVMAARLPLPLPRSLS